MSFSLLPLFFCPHTEHVPELCRDWHQHQEPDGGFPEEEAKGAAETGVHRRYEGTKSIPAVSHPLTSGINKKYIPPRNLLVMRGEKSCGIEVSDPLHRVWIAGSLYILWLAAPITASISHHRPLWRTTPSSRRCQGQCPSTSPWWGNCPGSWQRGTCWRCQRWSRSWPVRMTIPVPSRYSSWL